MALDLRRLLWASEGLMLIVGTEGFLNHALSSARGAAGVAGYSATSATSGSRLPDLYGASFLPPTRRKILTSSNAVRASLWGAHSLDRTATTSGCLFSVEQSVDGGVMLPPAENSQEYASFLAESIQQHLDEEWIEQECHKAIGEEAARLYVAAVEKGDADLTTLVLDIGSAMENFDMGDAFVGAWDIANLVSDFLMEKMGAETSGCSTKAPTSLPSKSTGSFHLTSEKVEKMQADLTSDFARYRFLVDFMEGDVEWEQVNTLLAIYQGYTPEDAEQTIQEVRRGWAEAFPGPTPPDLNTAEGFVEALEADFPEDPDLLDGLEVIVETVYGGEAKRLRQGDIENGVPPDPAYLRRSTVCKWLYLVGFLSDDIKRAPDDPQQLADLVTGRARLKHAKK